MCEIFQKKNNVGQNWDLSRSFFLKLRVIENYKKLKIMIASLLLKIYFKCYGGMEI
jgi:hypothetical protein